MSDVFGKGLLAYHKGNRKAKFKVESDIAETEYWPVAEFFHTYEQMSAIERKALSLCRGLTLDVGAGSGSHALWLNQNGITTHAIDISEGAVEVMLQRGLTNAQNINFFDLAGRGYDTLLFLMNGAGIAGTVERLPQLLNKAKELLNPGGQILMDSSDLIYLYENEDGSVDIDLAGKYYGELEYTFTFAGEKGEPFEWLFAAPDVLSAAAASCGLKCDVVEQDEHYQFLARIY
ncbi:MAG: class I SAM-dependent methyltransferase [Bacteroidales bacterium]|nr:class I SAM-dependent methyltransferase [Bacteroidales bacterium]